MGKKDQPSQPEPQDTPTPAPSTAVAEQDRTPKAVATGSLYKEDAGAGFEDLDSSEVLIPFVSILQRMSPQVNEDDPAHIEGAKAGMFFNTATKDVFGKEDGMVFIPVHRDHKFIEWIPREKGGGFVAAHTPDSPAVLKAKAEAKDDFSKLSIGENQLVETFYMFGVRVDEYGNTFPEVLAFSSTQIKAYKTWMTKARGIKLHDEQGRPFPAPLFAHKYRITTQLQQNSKGSWHGYVINFDGKTAEEARLTPDDPFYIEAKALRDMVTSGMAQADIKKAQSVGTVEPELGINDRF